MKKRSVRYSLLVIAVLWMTVIFSFSAQTGTESGGLSAIISKPLTDLILLVTGDIPGEREEALFLLVDGIVRMFAHFTEYTVLGMLITAVLRAFGVKRAWISFLLGIGYAVTDELHQAYSPGRTSDPMDVLIDAAGVLFGILIYHGARYVWRKKHVHDS